MKRCTVCKAMKDEAAFATKGPGKLRSYCRACGNEKTRRRYQQDAEYRKRAIQRSAKNVPVLTTMDPEKAERLRAKRREKKRIGRIRGASGYRPAYHDAHVRLWDRYSKTLVPHDAHVRACQAVHRLQQLDAHVRAWSARQKWKRHEQQPATRTTRIKRRAKARQELAESYIVCLMTDGRKNSREAAGLSAEFIELKRAHLRLMRFLNDRKETEA